MATIPTRPIPPWVFHSRPLNAQTDAAAAKRLEKELQNVAGSLYSICTVLDSHHMLATYEPLANLAVEHVWPQLDACLDVDPGAVLHFADHLPRRARNRVLRRLARHPHESIRRSIRKRIDDGAEIREVALPQGADKPWNATGWLRAVNREGMARPRRRSQAVAELPKLTTVKQAMKALGIVSPAQLGWMLLATDEGDGPYTSFAVPKRQRGRGEPKMRKICAPKWQLRRVQQRILHDILDHVPPHNAAHGFVRGRSTVTNAEPHRQKALLLKFDLVDFFPTITYLRVMGLFASLGFPLSTIYFSTNKRSRQVAPMLARLCTYADDPQEYRAGVLPQGAPTSPAISNLICRRLDARLSGLAEKHAADYTRYADDLTFSFAEAGPELSVGRFRWWVDQICYQEGFFVNQEKFRAIRPSQRQTVTGIVVNDQPRVPRETRRRVRAMLHRLKVRGIAAVSAEDPGFASHLLGMLSYMAMVHPADGELLREGRALLRDGSGPVL